LLLTFFGYHCIFQLATGGENKKEKQKVENKDAFFNASGKVMVPRFHRAAADRYVNSVWRSG